MNSEQLVIFELRLMEMYLQKVITKKLFVGILKANEESRIWFRNSVVRIRGWGYVSKCHGPGTLTESLKMQYIILPYFQQFTVQE